ncbi:hypothetical protein D1871_23020 [Nakamurella silvestris]|nr:hypothetical protein D1871_23020 [Nakamurella silvestris]
MSDPSSSLAERQGFGLARRDLGRLARGLSNVQAGSTMDVARIDAAGRRFEEVLAANTQLTEQAMGDVIRVAVIANAGAQLAPLAAGDLQYLRSIHTVGEGTVLLQAQRQLGRLV